MNFLVTSELQPPDHRSSLTSWGRTDLSICKKGATKHRKKTKNSTATINIHFCHLYLCEQKRYRQGPRYSEHQTTYRIENKHREH